MYYITCALTVSRDWCCLGYKHWTVSRVAEYIDEGIITKAKCDKFAISAVLGLGEFSRQSRRDCILYGGKCR